MKLTQQLAVISSLVVVLMVGCQKSTEGPSAAGGIAVIDLDRVARELGSDKQITTAIQQRQAALNKQLVGIANAYIKQLDEARKTVETKNEKSPVSLAQYEQKANKNLGVAKRQAQQNLSQHRGQLVKQFRDAVRPAAREAAKARGLGVIVTKQEGLLFDCAQECDITADVISRLRTKSATQQQVALQASGPQQQAAKQKASSPATQRK